MPSPKLANPTRSEMRYFAGSGSEGRMTVASVCAGEASRSTCPGAPEGSGTIESRSEKGRALSRVYDSAVSQPAEPNGAEMRYAFGGTTPCALKNEPSSANGPSSGTGSGDQAAAGSADDSKSSRKATCQPGTGAGPASAGGPASTGGPESTGVPESGTVAGPASSAGGLPPSSADADPASPAAGGGGTPADGTAAGPAQASTRSEHAMAARIPTERNLRSGAFPRKPACPSGMVSLR